MRTEILAPKDKFLSEIKNRQVDHVSKPAGSLNFILLHKDKLDILPHLFGRQTTKYHLKDLLSLGTCSLDTFTIVLDYIKKLACVYAETFNQECFKIQDTKDGIKKLMLRGLDDNSNYLMSLGDKFYNQFTEYIEPD